MVRLFAASFQIFVSGIQRCEKKCKEENAVSLTLLIYTSFKRWTTIEV